MSIISIFLIAVSLSMDALAVSICKGLTIKNKLKKTGLIMAIYFGLFQALMPLLGYLLGSYFWNLVEKIDHFIVFIILTYISFSMINDSNNNDKISESTNLKEMIILSIATSIDALAIGITFAFLKVNILLAILIIGVTCASISFIGTIIGNKFGNKYGNKSTLIGGIVLFLIGVKILLEHLKLF